MGLASALWLRPATTVMATTMAKDKERDSLADLVGAVVRARRRAQSLTQEELADRIGISVVTLSNIERGENVPTLSVFFRLHRELGLDASELAGAQAAARRVSRDRLQLEAEALELLRGADMRDLRLLISLAKAMQGR